MNDHNNSPPNQDPAQAPPPEDQQGGPPPGYQQGPPPGYQQGPPPGYPPPPPGYQQGPHMYPHRDYNRPVNIIEAYKAYWVNIFDFNNRTSRAGYWWVFLTNFIISTVLSSISSSSIAPLALLGGDYSMQALLGPFYVVYVISIIWSIANVIPGLSIMIRRFHDVGKRWYWIFIGLIPFAGVIILIVILAGEQKHAPENELAYLPQV